MRNIVRGLVWNIGLLLVGMAAWGQAVAAGAGAPGSSSAAGQAAEAGDQAVTTIKVQTRVVEISAVVKGKDGEPRGGMTKEDFVLKQDGREAPIRYFSQGSELPLTLALMVDTSGSQRTFIGDEAQASDVFFDTMLGRKEDRAMLVQFNAGVQLLRGLTNSDSALHLSLLNLTSRPSAAAAGTLLNDAVYTVAKDTLARETGRKAMVILSDGGDNGSRRSLAEAIEQAQRGDVQVYSILYSAWDLAGGLGPGAAGGGMPHGISGGRPVGPDPGLAALEKLSESTGGRVFTVSRTLGLREIFNRIGQDLRLQYEVGYTPPPDLEPNSYHRLELRARDKKLSVQARRGFFARP